MSKSKNDIAWEKLFEKYCILDKLANNERIIKMCELLKQKGFICKDDITQNMTSITDRLLFKCGKVFKISTIVRENQPIGCILTRDGFCIFNFPIIERQLEFIKLILSHTAFQDTLRLYFDKRNVPTKDEIVEIMKKCKIV